MCAKPLLRRSDPSWLCSRNADITSPPCLISSRSQRASHRESGRVATEVAIRDSPYFPTPNPTALCRCSSPGAIARDPDRAHRDGDETDAYPPVAVERTADGPYHRERRHDQIRGPVVTSGDEGPPGGH